MRRPEAERLRRLDIFGAALPDHQAAREPREFRPPHDEHGDHGVARADAERRGDRHCEDDRREAEHEVGDAHQRLFREAARIGRDRAEQRAECAAEQDHDEAHRKRHRARHR